AVAGARAAHARLVAHVERAAADGDPDAALGGAALTALMSSAEATRVDLGRLAEQADAERDRLHALLADGCARVDAGRPALDRTSPSLHPRARPGPLPRRGVPGRPGARVTAVVDGDDVVGRARRAR